MSSSVNYYSDAKGIFSLSNPPSVDNDRLMIQGMTTLPEVAIHIRKKYSAGEGTQAVYRTKGKSDFQFYYVIKNGAGVYDFIIFGKKYLNALTLNGLCSFSVRIDTDMPNRFAGPDINNKIIQFIDSVIGKTVGYGECWDLAQEALDINGADWTRPYIFGTLLDSEKDAIMPGDIIQFRSVRLVMMTPAGVTITQTIGAPDHTAVITAVEGKNLYKIAQQNSDGKRYVIISMLDLSKIQSGTYKIYRPVAGIFQ